MPVISKSLHCTSDEFDGRVTRVETWKVAPLATYDGWRHRVLFHDLDEHGMRLPLVAFRMTPEEWAQRPVRADVGRSMQPFVWPDGSILAIKYGNQRHKWARMRRYTSVPVVVCDTEEAAEWIQSEMSRLSR